MSRTVSAMFDSQAEAQRAVAALRDAGVSDNSLSVVTRHRGSDTDVVRDGDDGEHTNILRGVLGGGALGSALGIAALAIPGVGPFVAAGSIAAVAVPGAMGIGAAAGAVAGTFNEAMKDHGVSDADAAYYGNEMGDDGVFVSVDGNSRIDPATAEEILYRHGGHNSTRGRGSTASNSATAPPLA